MQNETVTTYERLEENDRTRRRTIADALEIFRQAVGFADADCAEVRIGPLRLPSGEIVGLVVLQFEHRYEAKTYLVSLPTSTNFTAIRPGSSYREKFAIALLDRAMVDGSGRVQLAEGEHVSAVEVVPSKLLVGPSELDWKIVHSAVAVIDAEEQCYRRLGDGLPAHLQHGLPDVRFLDCSKLPGLKVPSVKVIARYMSDKDPSLKNLSHQKIADALKKFGMRRPVRRRRIS